MFSRISRPGRLSVAAAGGAVAVLVTLFTAVSGAAARQGSGAISGIVTVDDVPEPMMVAVTTDQAVCGNEVEDRATVVDPSGRVANAVIIVTGAPWGNVAPEPVLTNSGCYFVPRVQVAKTRTEVEVRSDDDTLHTTHAYDDRQRTLFNIAIPVPGLVVKRPLRRPGPVRLECDSHRWMRGWVYVTDDVAAVSGADGRFELSGIPPGTYELTVWHERYEGRSQQVTVTAGGTADVSVSVR